MALFVDGPAVSVDSLTQYDSNVLAVAASEGINLTTKILISQDELYLAIEQWIARGEFREQLHHCGIAQVVWSKAMRVWQVYRSLALIYRDAYYSQLNDRNQTRAAQYETLSQSAQRDFADDGLGYVTLPMHRPQQPQTAFVPAQESGGTYYFSISWTNDFGQESSASVVLSVDVTDGNAVDLTVAPSISENATGWNLYAGVSPEQVFLQNDTPLQLDSDWAYLPSQGITGGRQPGFGQAPERHFPLHRYVLRG